MATYLQYNDPIRITWRKGDETDPYVDKNESNKIINNVIILSEIPDKFNHVIIDGYAEIYEGTPVLNEFVVNYQNGMVTFHSSKEGLSVTAIYKGRGFIQYPAVRIYANRKDMPDVMQNLQEIIDNSQTAIDAIDNMAQMVNDANTAIDNSEAATGDANLAATRANTAAGRAENATNETDLAITSAYTEATNARTQADNALVQANNALGQANNAQTQAAYAKTQGDHGKTQGDYAKVQGDYALSMGDNLANKGAFNSATTYYANNIVTYNGATYQAIATSTGITPDDLTKWEKLWGAPDIITVNGKVGNVVLDAIDVNAVKNLGNVQSIQAGLYSAIPAGVTNALYLATDTKKLYRFNGISWVQLFDDVDWSKVLNKVLSSDVFDGLMSKESFAKLAGIEANANNYVHPASHPASMIIEDSTHRFVTDVLIDTLTNKKADLDAGGKVPLNQLPDTARQSTYIVADAMARNALTGLLSGDRAFETTTRDSYIWDGTVWILTADADWANVNLDWANINGKPTSTVANIDDAVTKRHVHTNQAIIDAIQEAFTTTLKNKLDAISANAKNVASSATNGNIKIDNVETVVYVHPTGDGNLHVPAVGDTLIPSNFVGKVSGSTVENPHISKYEQGANVLLTPSGAWTGEVVNVSYTSLQSLNGTLHSATRSLNGNIAQQIFSFNLIEAINRKYGAGTVQGADTAARVAWLKANVTKLTANWHGFGSNPAGNKATMVFWNTSTSSYDAPQNHASASVTKLTQISSNMNVRIDANGFFNVLAYAEPSNGTIASTINTDYVELITELSANPNTGKFLKAGTTGVSWSYNDLGTSTGTISDVQHGQRAGGNLHTKADGSSDGFMSKEDFAKLQTIEANATATAYPVVGETQPSVGLKEGLVWYKTSADEAKMYLDGSFRNVGGTPPVIGTTQPTSNLKEGLIWYNPNTDSSKIYLSGMFRSIGGGQSAIKAFFGKVTLNADVASFAHGVLEYNKSLDIMYIHKNGTYMHQGTDFTISEDGTTINSLMGNWLAESQFEIMVLASVPENNVLKTVMLENIFTAIGGETNIPIGIALFNPDSDVLDVTLEVPLYNGVHYALNVNRTTIDLLSFSLTAGQQVRFQVWKQIRTSTDALDGGLLVSDSVALTKLAPDVQDSINETRSANSTPLTIQGGLGIYNVTNYGVFDDWYMNGRTLVNLLGRLGNGESLYQWTATPAILALDTTVKVSGTSSFKLTYNGTGAGNDMAATTGGNIPIKDTSKYVLIGYVKPNVGTAKIVPITFNNTTVTGDYGVLAPAYSDTSKFNLSRYKFIPNAGSNLLQLRLFVGASGNNANFDEIRLYEVSTAEYTAFDTLTDAQVAAKYPYVDDMKHVNAVYATNTGKNLLPPFSEWVSNDSSTQRVVTGAYAFTVQGKTAGLFAGYGITIPVVGGQTYTLRAPVTVENIGGVIGVGAYYNLVAFDANGTTITNLDSAPYAPTNGTTNLGKTFTVPTNAVGLRVVLGTVDTVTGTFTFTNPMLNIGATALTFEPQKSSYIYLPDVQLKSNVDGSVRDELKTDGQGKPRVTRRFREMVLDGSLTWVWGSDFTGYKMVGFVLNGGAYNSDRVVKYDGKILSQKTVSFNSSDSSAYESDNYFRISVADTDSGWGETYTPSVAEIQAYFMGWRMYNNDVGFATPYNGTGTKGWAWINGSGGVLAVPTTMSGWANYTPYRLNYQLAASVDEAVNYEGSLMLHEGNNQVEVGTGIVVREVAKPSDPNGNMFINNSTATGSALKYRTNKILSVFKYAIKDNAWTIRKDYASATAIGGADAYVPTNSGRYDQSATYSVTYLALDTHTLGIAPTTMIGEYAPNIKESLDSLVRELVEARTEISILQNEKAQKKQPQWIAPTLLNAWVAHATTSEQPGFMLDDFGNVHIRGVIKSGTTTANTPLFVLPKGFRPLNKMIKPALSSNSTSHMTVGLLVLSDGTVQIDAVSPYNTWMVLDITFRAEQ